jgi:hypothetical protein
LVGAVVLCVAAVAAAPSAQAAGKSVTPTPSCYFDNGDGTVTVTVDVTSTNTTATTLPIGSQNKINPGAQDRGQPTTFAPGTTTNAWSATFSSAEYSSVRWNLDGNTVPLQTSTVCAAIAVPADSNPLAVVVFGALTSLVGAAFLGERRRRHRTRAIA